MKKILIFTFIFVLCAAIVAPASALTYGNAYPEWVYYWDGSVFTGQTGDAQTDVPGDVPLGRDTAPKSSALYITAGSFDGVNTYFNEVWINITTPGEGGSPVWEYMGDGSGWKTLTVTDETESFTHAGWGKVSWTIPSDWIGSSIEGKSGLWVRAKTVLDYGVQPLAGEINILAYNLQVKVQDNLDASVTGLAADNFTLSDCSDTAIHGIRELGSGVYELALATRGDDLNCNINVLKSGWTSSGAKSTGDMDNNLISLTAIPFELTEVVVPPPVEEEIAFGSLVKTESSSAVYYYASNGKRYVFPNDKVFFTWYDDFSSVTTISADELAAMQIGGNVTYRPGYKMIKIQSDPKTYAVTRGGTLRWIQTEALATALYGQDWNTKIDDVDVAFWPSYKFGTDIQSSSDYGAASELTANPTINIDLGL
ncbi:MAG: hypothetical protein PHW53_02110 [Patescibacteria group bacterium]|nr:hypothetical protein [Patescibacteria group bacterium]